MIDLKSKKIFLILLFVVFSALIGYFIYTLFIKPLTYAPGSENTSTSTIPGQGLPSSGSGQRQIATTSQNNNLPGTQEKPGTIPQAQPSEIANGNETKANPVVNVPAMAATISGNGNNIQYYNKQDGKFYRINEDGQPELISEKIFYNLQNVTWSPDKNKAILEYPDGANTIYDFSNNKQITMPNHWKDFNFSPNGSEIVLKSMGQDPDNRWLAIANADGSNARTIEELGKEDDKVYPLWSPNNQSVAMFASGVDFNRQEVYFVGQNKENFKSTVIEGRGFQPKWSPDGERLLYSVYSSDTKMNPDLWIVNARGDEIGTGRKDLHIETWANKCTFANDTELYCAVPKDLDENSGLIPDLAKDKNDELYRIDTMTGLQTLVAIPDGNYNMNNLVIDEGGRNIYFTDANTSRLMQIKLK
jgi:Tol biopolymer transport system component